MIGKGISGRTRVFGLIGHPVRHSLSPAMHSALFERLGLDAVYLAFDVHPDRAAGVADAIRTGSLDLPAGAIKSSDGQTLLRIHRSCFSY